MRTSNLILTFWTENSKEESTVLLGLIYEWKGRGNSEPQDLEKSI